jgi:hypothetical protein
MLDGILDRLNPSRVAIREQQLSLDTLREQLGKKSEQLSKLTTSLYREGILDIIPNYVDPREAFYEGPGSDLYMGMGYGYYQKRSLTEEPQGLAEMRRQCRKLAELNGYAINGHENRISYIIGLGHGYKVVPIEGIDVSKELLRALQKLIDKWLWDYKWADRQEEIVLRRDRDGECFLRIFDADDEIQCRFIEPEDVVTPERMNNDKSASQGIQTKQGDVETKLGYYVDGELIDAKEVQHRKLGTDSSVKRGMPLFWPVRKQLTKGDQILSCIAEMIAIQTSIAAVKKYPPGVNKAAVTDLVASATDFTVNNQYSGRTDSYQQYKPGTIVNAMNGMDWDFPAARASAMGAIEAHKHMLRSVAARLVLPEFMLTSDASNANYASTMVAEGPAVRMFERLQRRQKHDDLDIIWRVVRLAVERGEIDSNVENLVEIQAEPPTLAVRDLKQEAESKPSAQRCAGTVAANMVATGEPGLRPGTDEHRAARQRLSRPATVDDAGYARCSRRQAATAAGAETESAAEYGSRGGDGQRVG